MQKGLPSAKKYLKRRRRHRMWKRVVSVLACIVVFVTTYALILPAIALEQEKTVYCGYEEHEHTDECYEVRLICQFGETEESLLTAEGGEKDIPSSVDTEEESSMPAEQETEACQYYSRESIAVNALLVATEKSEEYHTHTDDCYQTEKKLVCGREECEGHSHSDDCFVRKIVCEQEESETHNHSDDCYETVTVCGKEEREEHFHTDDCYEMKNVLACGKEEREASDETGNLKVEEESSEAGEEVDESEESEEESFKGEEDRAGSKKTEADEKSETGEKADGAEEQEIPDEIQKHIHMDDCYEETVTCGLEAHIHTLICYSDPEADVETAEVWEKTLPEELSGIWADDLVAVAESQLGYEESTANYDVTEDEEVKGYTRYGEWYGDPYGDWNAMFAAFCLNYAKIPESAMPKMGDVQNWIEELADEKYDLYVEVQDYEQPHAGDMVFFDSDGNGEADRVGIVVECSEAALLRDAKIKTVEGDFDDKVQRGNYSLNDEKILGFGVLPENFNGEGLITQTFEGEDYTIAVTYGAEAGIPETAVLSANEYDQDSDSYLERYKEAVKINGWQEDKKDKVRLFSIGFYADGVAVEPEDEVSVNITYHNRDKSADYGVIHFAEEENEIIEAKSEYEAGEQTIEFVVNGFSDILTYELEKTEPVEDFMLWLYVKANRDAENEKIVCYANNVSWDSGYVTEAPLKDVLHIKDTNYFLIPIDYFETDYQSYGYSFDAESACPFVYAPSAFQSGINLTRASYVSINDKWYVRVEDKGGYSNPSNSRSNIYYYSYLDVVNDTVNHPSSVINLFDYWTIGQNDVDVGRNDFFSGINSGHALKFSYNRTIGSGNTDGNWNVWTGDRAPYQGIVENQLRDGYPVLSGDEKVFVPADPSNVGDADRTESLRYLFDPTWENAYRETHRNVSGLLQKDSDGYYYYDSGENFAEYHEDTNSFTLYNTWGVTAGGSSPNGQFFPFNSMKEVADLKSTDSSINHYFGMTLSTRFVQQHGGYTTANRGKKTIFEFAGDDDVWIFIDDVLIVDLGGIHDRASVTIDFATGEVMINDGDDQSTTLREAFENAGKEPHGGWNDNNEIFRDNSYHTLTFFYLERGNTDSNLFLKYNLTEIPATAIYKVDQYGEVVPNATFAVYAANEDYQYVSDGVSPSDPRAYDENWDIWDIKDGNTTIKALYVGTTDANGEMIFEDADKMPYSLDQLEGKFGKYFILKEVAVPEGYRLVSDEIHLSIKNNVLICQNTYDSGVRADPTLLVEAPGQLELVNGNVKNYYALDTVQTNGTLFAVVLKYVGNGDGDLRKQESWVPVYGDDKAGYAAVDVENNFVKAAIDAAKKAQDFGNVVFETAPNGTMQLEMTNLPGDILSYYYMLEAEEKEETRYTVAYYWTEADSLNGADENNTFRVNSDLENGNCVFSRTFGATIRVPNLINRLLVQKFDRETNELVNGAVFALYKVEENEGKIRYSSQNGTVDLTEVSYSIDPATGVITACMEETSSVEICPAVNANGKTLLEVTTGAAVNQAHEDGTGIFTNLSDGTYYLREISAPEGYEVNDSEIMILVTGDAIYACAGTPDDGVSVARGPGYVVSSLDKFASQGIINNTLTWIYTMLRVDVDSEEDGYSFDDIDKYTMSGKEGVGADDAWLFAVDRYGKTTHLKKEAMRTYLKYNKYVDGTENGALFNYEFNGDHGISLTNTLGASSVEQNLVQQTRRLYTDVGWSYLEIYQDYEYGSKKVEETNEHQGTQIVYENLADVDNPDISNLFSRSVYVQVSDERAHGDLEISKTVRNAPERDASKFKFTVKLYKGTTKEDVLDENDKPVTVLKPKPLTGDYSYIVYNITAEIDESGTPTGELRREEARDESGDIIGGIVQNGSAEIILTADQVVVISGLPANTEYTVVEAQNSAYSTTAVRDKEKDLIYDALEGDEAANREPISGEKSYTFDKSEERTVTGTLYWKQEESGNVDTTSTVEYINTYLPDFTLVKVDSANEDTKLAGAQFVFYYQETVSDENGVPITVNRYYHYDSDGGTVSWLAIPEDKDEKYFALSSAEGLNAENAPEKGTIVFSHIPDGSYHLKETSAPNGYKLLADIIDVTVTGGKITGAYAASTKYNTSENGLEIIIPNSSGVILPDTGGVGTKYYTYGGLFLLLIAVMYGYILKCKKQ